MPRNMPKLFSSWLFLCFCVGIVTLTSCSLPPDATSAAPEGTAVATPAASPVLEQTTSSNLPRLNGKATVEMVVKGQPITIEVDGTYAPITAGNFVDLVERGVYTGTIFHRVVREPEPFVVQGGDPQTKDPSVSSALWGQGSFLDPATKQPRLLPLEITPKGEKEPIYSRTFRTSGINTPPQLQHVRGVVAMARSQSPDSASAQFYFTLADLPFLDGDYAVFGTVTQGMDVVDQIQQGDKIDAAKVTAGAENLKKG